MRCFAQAVVLLALLGLTYGGNVLVFLPMPFYSHTATYMPIFKELALRGHNVTVVSPFPQKEPVPNLTDIVVPNLLVELTEKMKGNDLREFKHKYYQAVGIWIFAPNALEVTLSNDKVQEFIKREGDHFDVIILETFFIQELFVSLGHKYNAPVVNILNHELTSYICEVTGNTMPYSYVPNYKIHATDRMSFLQRLENTLMNWVELAGAYMYYLPLQEKAMKKYMKFPGSENLPPLIDMLKDTSLTLVDNHFSFGYPRPYLNNIKEFGGLSLKQAGPLPKDIEKFMAGAKHGVIYFSWGSHMKSTTMKPHELQALVGAFSKIPQRVIMKWENETLPGKPDNVYFASWLPQASILAHPNCVLFITHGGIHGLYEAMARGLPVIGTPLFADQPQNILWAVDKGFAINLELEKLSAEVLHSAIKEIISNPSYKQNAVKMAQLLLDRPLTPLDNAVYWIEYVMRHKGAPHLKPAVLDIPFYQYYLLDVLLVIALVSFILIKVLCKLLKLSLCAVSCVFGFILPKRSKKGKSKKE